MRSDLQSMTVLYSIPPGRCRYGRRKSDFSSMALAAVVAAAVFQAAQAHAAGVVYTWNGNAGDGAWFTTNNWNQNAVPGTTQNGAITNDQAQITNVSGTITYTPGTPTNFDYLNITKSDAALLTVNINGNLTTLHTVGGAYATSDDGIGGAVGCNLALNVNSGTYAIQNRGFVSYANLTVAAPATLDWGTVRPAVLVSGSVTVRGTMTQGGLRFSDGDWATTVGGQGGSVRIGSFQIGPDVTIDGGRLVASFVYWDHNVTTVTRILSITNGGSLFMPYGAGGMYVGSGAQMGNYNVRVNQTSGTVTNRGVLVVGHDNGEGPSYYDKPGTGVVQVTGGTWIQGGSAHIGSQRIGSLTVNGDSANWSCPAEVWVGGYPVASTRPKPVTAPCGGTLTVAAGTVSIRNPNAGVSFSAGDEISGGSHVLKRTGGRMVEFGQRVVFDTLGGTGTGLTNGAVYYVMNPGNINYFYAQRDFCVAATSYGTRLTGTAYSSATYHTLPARLLIGNSTGFSDGTMVIPGTLNLSGGLLDVDELVATNGANSSINITGGTLSASAMTVSNGTAFTVGNGVSASTLNLTGSNEYSFADGLVLNTNAVLAVGNTNAIGAVALTGNVTLRAGAILDLDFNATTNDWLQVTGTVTLPTVATLRARALDSSMRTPIPVLQATLIVGSAAGWKRCRINGRVYVAVVNGNQLVLERLPEGGVLVFR